MIRLDVTVDDITSIMAAGYTVIRVYTDVSSTGDFATLDGTITLVAVQTGYAYTDTDGTTATWYKTAYYGSGPGLSAKSSAQQGGTVDAYCTAFDVRQELAVGSGNAAVNDDWDDVLWDLCVSCSRLIDAYKDVEEGAYLASGSEVRYFDGPGDGYLWLDTPAVSVSLVEVEETDGTWTSWAAADWWSWPYNASPIKRLDVSDRVGGAKSVWDRGPKRVRVTGVWGISTTVPSLVEQAARIQVARWYKRAMQGWADSGGSVEFGALAYGSTMEGLDRDVRAMLRIAEPRTRVMV